MLVSENYSKKYLTGKVYFPRYSSPVTCKAINLIKNHRRKSDEAKTQGSHQRD